MTLRDALVEFSLGWRNDLGPAWQGVLSAVEPDADAVDPTLDHGPSEPIFPGRKGHLLPSAPRGSHVFHALDSIAPAQVKAIVVGQDPYPRISWATGRSFEQGNIDLWPAQPSLVSDSLERIIPSAMEARTGNADYTDVDQGSTAWSRIAADLAGGTLDLQPPAALFDYWQGQGVLFLNSGLTLSRFKKGGSPHQLRGHIPFWRPIVREILRSVAIRPDGHVVFLLWGKIARDLVQETGIQQVSEQAGTWQTQVRFVSHAHPAASDGRGPSFFLPPNPFVEANQALAAMGARAIAW